MYCISSGIFPVPGLEDSHLGLFDRQEKIYIYIYRHLQRHSDQLRVNWLEVREYPLSSVAVGMKAHSYN